MCTELFKLLPDSFGAGCIIMVPSFGQGHADRLVWKQYDKLHTGRVPAN